MCQPHFDGGPCPPGKFCRVKCPVHAHLPQFALIPDLHTFHTTFSYFASYAHKGLSILRILAVDANSKTGLVLPCCSTSISRQKAHSRGGKPGKDQKVAVRYDSGDPPSGQLCRDGPSGSLAVVGERWRSPELSAQTGGRAEYLRRSHRGRNRLRLLGSVELGLRPIVLASGCLLRPHHCELGNKSCA